MYVYTDRQTETHTPHTCTFVYGALAATTTTTAAPAAPPTSLALTASLSASFSPAPVT